MDWMLSRQKKQTCWLSLLVITQQETAFPNKKRNPEGPQVTQENRKVDEKNWNCLSVSRDNPDGNGQFHKVNYSTTRVKRWTCRYFYQQFTIWIKYNTMNTPKFNPINLSTLFEIPVFLFASLD